MMLRAILKKVRAVIRVEAEPATVKVLRAVAEDTGKAEPEIDADTLKAKAMISKAVTRRDLRKAVRVEPAAIVVRRVGIKTTKRPSPSKPSPPTTTSEADVAALSRTTRRSHPSISVPLVLPEPHVPLVVRAARVRSVAALFPTMPPGNRNRPEAIRLNVVRLADHAVTAKRAIANCRLVAEVNVRDHRRVR